MRSTLHQWSFHGHFSSLSLSLSLSLCNYRWKCCENDIRLGKSLCMRAAFRLKSLPLSISANLAYCYLLKHGTPSASFSFVFALFTTNPSSIWCQESNSLPSNYESPPSTTRPGLPPAYYLLDTACPGTQKYLSAEISSIYQLGTHLPSFIILNHSTAFLFDSSKWFVGG